VVVGEVELLLNERVSNLAGPIERDTSQVGRLRGIFAGRPRGPPEIRIGPAREDGRNKLTIASEKAGEKVVDSFLERI
jgi:hypothetical protein